MALEEISKIISKYEGVQRAELVDFYLKIVNDRIENGKPIDHKKIQLIQDVSSFITKEERKSLMNKAINIKICQVRSFILENFKDDLHTEKTHFATISKWMLVTIKEISNTFVDSSTSISKEFHKKLIEEFALIFCSYKKLNSAGNQLLIDFSAYFHNFPSENSQFLFEKVEKNFLPSKAYSPEKISELYNNI
jgi:hypothetical protein